MYEPPALVPGFALVYCAVAGLVSGLQRIAIQIATAAGTGLMLTAVAFALPLGNSIHRQCLGNVAVILSAEST